MCLVFLFIALTEKFLVQLTWAFLQKGILFSDEAAKGILKHYKNYWGLMLKIYMLSKAAFRAICIRKKKQSDKQTANWIPYILKAYSISVEQFRWDISLVYSG
jgi:hypothetical protein